MNIYVTGPTASGKTKLAIEISKLTNLPIYNCDSRQFWKSMRLLTCSPTEKEKSLASHYLFNTLEDNEVPSLGRWINLMPVENKIIVGGTAFYIDSLLRGVPMVNISEETTQLASSIKNPYEFLKAELKEDFPIFLHREDQYRIYRLLRFYLQTGCVFEKFPGKRQEEGLVIVVNPSLDQLSISIKSRIENFIAYWIEEVKFSSRHKNFENIIGYKEIIDFLNNLLSFEQLKEKIYANTLKYAKSQKKFIRRLPIDIEMSNINSLDLIRSKIANLEL